MFSRHLNNLTGGFLGLKMKLPRVRGGLPYETDGDACRLAWGCKFWILVSVRVFRAKRQETQNYAKRTRSQIFFLTCFVYRIASVIISVNQRFLQIVEM